MKVRRIVIFGKGGIGKSTLAASLAILLHRRGLRVLQVGCDPKHDSALKHAPDGAVEPVMDALLRDPNALVNRPIEDFIASTRTGVDVMETGGPEPGRGCAGRGVSLALDLLDRSERVRETYDVAVFDVLGDVVCGGFASPIRTQSESDVILVVSREFMSLYAANNIARGIRNLAGMGGARLVGIVGNKIEDPEDEEIIARFAGRLGTSVIGGIPFDDEVVYSEIEGATVVEQTPESPLAEAYGRIVDKLLAEDELARVTPTPLDEPEIRALYKDHLERLRARSGRVR